MAIQMRTPKVADIKALAESQDRFKLFSKIFTHTPLGTPRVCDVRGIGAANVKKCKIPLKRWEQRIAKLETNGQCKGVRFFSFGKQHSFFRCDAAASGNLCDECKVCEGQCEQSVKGTAVSRRESLFARGGSGFSALD